MFKLFTSKMLSGLVSNSLFFNFKRGDLDEKLL